MDKSTCRLKNNVPQIRPGPWRETRVNQGPKEEGHPQDPVKHFHWFLKWKGAGTDSADPKVKFPVLLAAREQTVITQHVFIHLQQIF